jgi:heme-degrading monooxygenase HmoA
MSIVKINALTVPQEQREILEKRFAGRAGSVENSDGFEWFELLRPVEGTDQYLVYTRWRSEEDFQAWMEGPMKEAHQGGGAEGEKPKRAAPIRHCGRSRSCSRRRRRALEPGATAFTGPGSPAGLHPLGRTGEVGDVVDAVLCLENAPFVTGDVLHVDGGQSAGH